ncbi:ribonuclease H-like domain-containing protein [Tanacetum coccineum]|uniref:Ribonuclease H-like domain-containing protein n=1 Tax=Tanacetum coccineum TaxID=301880 RepID=A0ABQ5IT68_9ASTR
MQTVAGDGVASIKRRRRDQSSDDVRIMVTASGRGRLKDDLESSTWRRHQDCKATPSRRQLYKYKSVFKAKQTREPFLLSEHKSVMLAELVHLDLWGPYMVVSKEGYRYFLTIVDDFTRAVWVYLLKTKDEVFDFVCAFFNLIKN